MAKHAKLSPSSADRWMTCPGSVALSEGLEDKGSSYADEGTAAHYLASGCLQYGHNAVQFVGDKIYLWKDTRDGSHFESFSGHKAADYAELLCTFEVDDDMAGAVQVYVDYARDVVKSTGGQLLVEQSVPIDHLTGEEGATGTSDTIILTEDELIVIDLKFGRGHEVSAEGNRQMRMYASGALAEYELLYDFKRVRMAISQPRISHQPSEWTCTIEELRTFEAEVAAAATWVRQCFDKQASQELVKYIPSEDACRWCKAKATCPALANFVEDSLGSDFNNLLTAPAPKVEGVTNDVLAKKMACIDLIEMWCTAVRAKVESELLQGNEVEGYKLVQGKKGNRAWTDAEAAEALMKSMRLKVDEMYDFKLISPTKAEKVLKDNPKKWTRINSLIGQSEGKASVAPASDKREALVLNPSSNDFDVILGEELA